MKTICISGIDTGVGKSIVTGLLAKYMLQQGWSVITCKPVQTGSSRPAEDLLVHRHLMGIGWSPDDRQGLTCPFCFSFPGSPHLAAKMAGSRIETAVIDEAISELAKRYDWLLIEGAGGLMVPLNRDYTMIDYIAKHEFPVVLVTSPRLGSINHTLLSLEALYSRKMKLGGLVYNLFEQGPREIAHDTLQVFSLALRQYNFADRILVLQDQRSSQEQPDWQNLLMDI